MEIKIEFSGNCPDKDYKIGDKGIAVNVIRAGNDRPYIVVIKDRRFVLAEINHVIILEENDGR